MAKIVIQDLVESVELDRQAMTAITGGARLSRIGSPSAGAGRAHYRADRIVGFPQFGNGARVAAPPPETSSARVMPRK